MRTEQFASVSIDVDTLGCYRAIHGLGEPEIVDDKADPIYTVALPRFLACCAAHQVRATLFVIGRDLLVDEHAEIVRHAAHLGHEIASHSHRHDYGLSRQSRAAIDDELARAATEITRVSGQAPRGFRAPGYNLSETLIDALDDGGYLYDSSLFPAPMYYAARATAIALHRAAGRRSHSLLGSWREFAGPRSPYHPSTTARHRAAKRGERSRRILEIPMGVSSSVRLPWLGTTLSLAPAVVGKALTTLALSSSAPAVLELHGMDLLGFDDVDDDKLVSMQPDLKVDGSTKTARIDAVIAQLNRSRPVIPLDELAHQIIGGRAQAAR